MSAITKEDQYSIVLRWSEPELYCLDLDPDHLHGYTHHHEGDVLALDEESDSDEFTIGDFACCVYDVAFASAHGESAFGLFDQSINSIHYYHALYDKKSARLRADVKQLVGRRTLEPNVLILDRLRIYPAHRGHDYGLLVLSTLIQRFASGVGLVVGKAFPLQFDTPTRPTRKLALTRATPT